jgi:hypothetical protein
MIEAPWLHYQIAPFKTAGRALTGLALLRSLVLSEIFAREQISGFR